MNTKQLKSSLICLLAAIIWGMAFVAQSIGGESLGGFTITCIRSYIGALALLPFVLFREHQKKKTSDYVPMTKQQIKTTILGGFCCGFCLFIASVLQQFGISADTPVGKAGFITALYIVLVPILGIFLKKKINFLTGIGVVLAIAGLYLLCITDGLNLQYGDTLILLCAFCFSVQILVVDHFIQKADGVHLGMLQLFFVGVFCTIPMFVLESPSIAVIWDSILPVLYLGVMSSGVAYTLQIIGQKNMNPTAASLILSLESVVSVISGCIILKETLSLREGFGCVLMFGAIILSQLPSPKKKVVES